MIVGVNRIVFPAQAVVDGQVAGCLPRIPCVQVPGGKPQGIRILELRDLANPRGEAEQELGPGVGRRSAVHGGAAIERSQGSVEPKGAAWCTEGSALRLEVIQRGLVVLESKAQVVGAVDLAHIDGREVLVVAELERAARAGVAQVVDSRDLKSGK